MSMNSFHRRSSRGTPRAASPEVGAPARRGMQRVDSLMVLRGLAPSRTVAQRLIAGGRVRHEGELVSKASLEVLDDARLSVEADEAERYVSRGGLKLAGALARTALDVRGLHCLDIGQSTGGFSDCLLQAGAATVTGVDVGHDQLHSRLRGDARVRCLEGLNARALSAADLGTLLPAGGFDLIVCDASFISLALLLPCWPALLAPRGQVLTLVKPQFEVGPQGLAKGGIVRDGSLFAGVRERILAAAENAGLRALDWFESPIAGGDGNREFFLHAALAGRPNAEKAHP